VTGGPPWLAVALARVRWGSRRARRGGFPAFSRGSSHSFADFYERLSPSVLRFFAHATGDPECAFDLTAETFARAFEKRGAFRGETEEQAVAWLWAIARSELAQFRRGRRSELAALARLGLERPAPSDEELRAVEEMTAAADAGVRLQRALTRLPPEQREAIQLRIVHRLGYEEIAARVGVSADVVRARCSRGLRALRASDQVRRAVRELES